jgi:AraC-like DNA-binding protein
MKMNDHLPSQIDWGVDDIFQQQPVGEGYVRIGPLVTVPLVLRELGVDPAEVISSVGLDMTLFDDPENIIAFPAMGRLAKVCVSRTQCPHFGLLIGQRAGADSLGLVGHLVSHSPNIGSALHSLVLHLHFHDRGAAPVLSVEKDLAMVSHLIYQQGVDGTDQIYDGAVAIIFNILRAMCGATWRPTEVLFCYSRPSDTEPYRRFFQAPLRFDTEQTAVVFPAKWLDHRVPNADRLLGQQLKQRIAVLETLYPRDFVGQLRAVLRILLITRQPSREQVAHLFSIHPRTLNRRLEERDCTFQGLVDEVRHEIARQLLENTYMPVGQIAAILDYSEASAFTRAFQRWSGHTPTAWRTQYPIEETHK